MHVIVRHSRADSHLLAAVFPERAGWDLHAILAGHAVDALRLLVWSKTKAARHGSGRPKSILPFGKKPLGKLKPKAAPLSVVRAKLDALHARRKPGPRHIESEAERSARIRDIFKGD